MRILLLEPHGDDALLSCHSILSTDNEIHLLTFSDHPSYGLEKYYPSIKELEFFDFPNLWYPDGKPILKTHEVHRAYLNGESIASDYFEKLLEVFGQDNFFRAVTQIQIAIESFLDNYSYDLVVCPAAVVHPYHVAVRTAWTTINYMNTYPTIYYADKYYIQNRYAKEMYEHLKDVWNIECEHNPGYEPLPEENSKIGEILWDVYPTEGKLLRFYSDIILWYPCKYMYNHNEKVEELINELE